MWLKWLVLAAAAVTIDHVGFGDAWGESGASAVVCATVILVGLGVFNKHSEPYRRRLRRGPPPGRSPGKKAL